MSPDELSRRAALRASAARRCVAALVFIALFAGASVYAGVTLELEALFPVESCCAAALALVITLELLPSISVLRRDGLSRRQVLRAFRRQLDQLPETTHPLEGARRA